MLKILALFSMALAIHAAEPPRCVPIPGAEQLWARPGLRFVVVGETHGTAETPAIFADLICAAHQTKRHIIAGVELRDGQLLSTKEWSVHDGRTSQAMWSLVERLRALKTAGAVTEVVGFSVNAGGSSAEEPMASTLLRAVARYPGALAIVLTGNVHACKGKLAEIGDYSLMASFLPPRQTVSLAVTDRGGQAWNCQAGTCGPHVLEPSGGEKRGIRLESPHPCFDGVLSTGLPATASGPAAQ